MKVVVHSVLSEPHADAHTKIVLYVARLPYILLLYRSNHLHWLIGALARNVVAKRVRECACCT